MYFLDAQYRDGDIRLVGGSYQWEGRVEIYFSETWGTVTDSDWTSNDAQAVCRKLGYFRPGKIEHEQDAFTMTSESGYNIIIDSLVGITRTFLSRI